MFVYQKFLIRDTDVFDALQFPRLETSLQEVIVQLSAEEPGPKTEMLLSFVMYRSINSNLIKDHPGLAALISGNTLPLQVMEDLFESSKNNIGFRAGLKEYITACMQPQQFESIVL